MKRLLCLLIVSALAVTACQPAPSAMMPYNQDSSSLNQPEQTTAQTERSTAPPMSTKTISDFQPIAATQATLVTSKGEITFELYREEAPLTTLNFLNLAKEGVYDGVVFHRVIPDFMAQVGDPQSKDPAKQALWGTGGPGYTIADEFGPGLKHDSEGIVSMANAGPNTGGSQFFITYEATPWLDGKHAIFGKVTAGMDVLKQIEVGDTIQSIKLQ